MMKTHRTRSGSYASIDGRFRFTRGRSGWRVWEDGLKSDLPFPSLKEGKRYAAARWLGGRLRRSGWTP